MEKVLVTGGGGFIGSRVIPFLAGKGYKVFATCRDIKSRRSDPLAEWIKTDLLKEGDRRDVIERVKPDLLLHLAWYVEHGKFWNAKENFDWVSASMSLVKHFHSCGGRRVVIAGTCAEYDWSGNLESFKETSTPLAPSTPYGVCKNALRELVHSFSSITSLSYCWGRLFFMYGQGEPQDKFVSSLISSLLHDKDFTITSGNKIRDFLHVDDVASGLVALLESDMEGPVNIGSGLAMPIKELANMASHIVEKEDLVRFEEAPPSQSDPMFLVGDVAKLNNEVGWTPEYNLEQGLRATIASMQTG